MHLHTISVQFNPDILLSIITFSCMEVTIYLDDSGGAYVHRNAGHN